MGCAIGGGHGCGWGTVGTIVAGGVDGCSGGQGDAGGGVWVDLVGCGGCDGGGGGCGIGNTLACLYTTSTPPGIDSDCLSACCLGSEQAGDHCVTDYLTACAYGTVAGGVGSGSYYYLGCSGEVGAIDGEPVTTIGTGCGVTAWVVCGE